MAQIGYFFDARFNSRDLSGGNTNNIEKEESKN